MSRKHKRREGQWWGSRWANNAMASEEKSQRQSVEFSGGHMSRGNSQGSDTFTCSVDGVTACSKAPNPDILFDSRLWQSVIGLCERFDTEWLAYLIGAVRTDGDYEIKKLSFPEQTAGGAHVKREPESGFQVEQGTVGVIHSHVGMQAFFSATDKAHANWPVEIVVNRKGEYEVSTRVQLPCGETMRRGSRIMLLTGGQLDSMEATLKEALKKGEEKRAKQSAIVWPGYGSGYGFSSGGSSWGGRPVQGSDREYHNLLGDKYLLCPIAGCGKYASGRGCCSHTLKEMEEYEKGQESQKQVAP